MSHSENAGEQSMEEILASIRGTVSKSEVKLSATGATAAATPEPPAQSPPPTSPVPHRLSDALSRVSGEQTAKEHGGASSSTSAQSFGTAPKEAAIDDDLSDLFEDPQPATANGVAAQSPVPSDDNSALVSSASAPTAPAPTPAPPASFGARMAAGAVSASTNELDTTPDTPSTRPTASPGIAPSPATARTSYSGLGPMPSAPAPKPASVAAEPHANAPEVIAAMPASNASPTETAASAAADGQPASSDGGGASLATLAATLGQLSAEALHPTPKPAAQPSEAPATSDPVNPALQATATAAPETPAVTAPTPVEASQAQPTPMSSEADATSDKAPAEAAEPPSRTLEDVVVDILRPQLQSWLEANMPRIVERALRAEAAGGKKSDTDAG